MVGCFLLSLQDGHPQLVWLFLRVYSRNGVMNSNGNLGKHTRSDVLPVVWVLTDDRPGNTTQAIGLARALNWPYEVKKLQFTPVARKMKKLFGPFAATQKGLDRTQSAALHSPWP